MYIENNRFLKNPEKKLLKVVTNELNSKRENTNVRLNS